MPAFPLNALFIAGSAYGRGGDPAIPWLRIVLAFLFCILVAFAAILWLRARQGLSVDFGVLRGRLLAARPPAMPRQMEIEERLRVSPASQVVILRCGERRYLVHVGPQGTQKIDRLDDAGLRAADRDE